ncbi:MAG: Cna B-type domain-containing protein [Gemmiger sp.]
MKLRSRMAALLCLLALLALFPAQVCAAGAIELDAAAGLTITEQIEGKAVPGAAVELYLISTVDETGELTPTTYFARYAERLDIRGKNDAAWESMAAELERDLQLGAVQGAQAAATAVTDRNGRVSFAMGGKDLPMGLYLVMGSRTELEGKVYTTAPFFALVPRQDTERNVWDYQVEAFAKPEVSPVRTDIEVVKVWKDECHRGERPKSVTIQLLCDGKAYGGAVTLPYNGRWSYTWQDLDTNHYWTVTETPVAGYKTPVIERQGNTFVVTNECSKPTGSGKHDLPPTGQLWWPVPVLLTAGLLLVVAGLARRRGGGNEK